MPPLISPYTCHTPVYCTPVCCKPVCLSIILPGNFSLMLILSWSSSVEVAQFLSGIILFYLHLWWCSYRFAVIFFQPLKDALSLPPNFLLFWWENYYKSSAAATMKLMFIFPLIVFNNYSLSLIFISLIMIHLGVASLIFSSLKVYIIAWICSLNLCFRKRFTMISSNITHYISCFHFGLQGGKKKVKLLHHVLPYLFSYFPSFLCSNLILNAS